MLIRIASKISCKMLVILEIFGTIRNVCFFIEPTTNIYQKALYKLKILKLKLDLKCMELLGRLNF